MLVNKVDPAKAGGSAWDDVKSGVITAQELIKDTTGKLEAISQAAGHNHDQGVEFGPEVLAAADALTM